MQKYNKEKDKKIRTAKTTFQNAVTLQENDTKSEVGIKHLKLDWQFFIYTIFLQFTRESKG